MRQRRFFPASSGSLLAFLRTSDRLSLATEEGKVQPVSTDTDSHRGTIWSNASTKKNWSWRTEHHQPPSTSSSLLLVSIQRARHGEYSSAR
ncbi:hypothetical protein AGOR_G00178220 [Albula goreensis]|uniref:Uncharacterized protein n=1 Tax=Albula goreensis TaxID=1534307 RepID=A0A8T3D3Y2_9TELE|nr:hypothetical protein AGOR_G00178220 [Albula goreensis]